MSNPNQSILNEEPTIDGMTAEDFARDAWSDDQRAEEQFKAAKEGGYCMHCGDTAKDGTCGPYKCWIA